MNIDNDKKDKKGLIILVILFTLIIAVLIFYFGYYKNKNNINNPVEPTTKTDNNPNGESENTIAETIKDFKIVHETVDINNKVGYTILVNNKSNDILTNYKLTNSLESNSEKISAKIVDGKLKVSSKETGVTFTFEEDVISVLAYDYSAVYLTKDNILNYFFYLDFEEETINVFELKRNVKTLSYTKYNNKYDVALYETMDNEVYFINGIEDVNYSPRVVKANKVCGVIDEAYIVNDKSISEKILKFNNKEIIAKNIFVGKSIDDPTNEDLTVTYIITEDNMLLYSDSLFDNSWGKINDSKINDFKIEGENAIITLSDNNVITINAQIVY